MFGRVEAASSVAEDARSVGINFVETTGQRRSDEDISEKERRYNRQNISDSVEQRDRFVTVPSVISIVPN